MILDYLLFELIDSCEIIALSLFVKLIQILISYMVLILLQVSNEEHSGLVDFGISGYGHAIGRKIFK